MKKTLTISTALAIALCGVGCAQTKPADEAPPAAEQSAETTEATTETTTEEAAPAIDWVSCKTADEAAKGAGFSKFGVIKQFKIGDLEFKNPTFAYAGGVAQATYETPATMVYVRKGVENYTTPLSDRKLDEFTQRWHKVLEGLDVTAYGMARGAATVATWTDGDTAYCLTFQGLGGEEMSMTDEELGTIVKGFNEANATTQEKKEEPKQQEQKQQPKQETKKSSLISENDAEALAEKACGGDCISIDRVNTAKYGECWYAICKDGDGVRYEYYVTNQSANLLGKTEPQKEEKKAEQKQDGSPSEGAPVTIYDSIYAEWHKDGNGTWAATFTTYNGTQINAYPAPAGGGWTFYAMVDGKAIQVVHSETESSSEGELGPQGTSSHWQELDGSRWF